MPKSAKFRVEEPDTTLVFGVLTGAGVVEGAIVPEVVVPEMVVPEVVVPAVTMK
jgi:hypothetical protein